MIISRRMAPCAPHMSSRQSTAGRQYTAASAPRARQGGKSPADAGRTKRD